MGSDRQEIAVIDESQTEFAIRARKLLNYAKENRRHMTRLELNLQKVIRRAVAPYRRGKSAHPLAYSVQPVICGFIPDFAILKLNLLIEADGPHHADQRDYDEWRDRKLRDAGYSVLRFSPVDINRNTEELQRRLSFIVGSMHNKYVERFTKHRIRTANVGHITSYA